MTQLLEITDKYFRTMITNILNHLLKKVIILGKEMNKNSKEEPNGILESKNYNHWMKWMLNGKLPKKGSVKLEAG